MSRLLDAFRLAVATDADYSHCRLECERALRAGDFTEARRLTARMDSIADGIGRRLRRERMN